MRWVAGDKARLMFSIGYAPPEVVHALERGDNDIVADPAADMWALGVIAFELLTNTPVFEYGTSKQKAFDASAAVSTLALSASQLSSFVTKICFQKTICQTHRPIGGWPEHCLDKFHETEGGRDTIGVRPRQGIDTCGHHIMGLMIEEGLASAWDDVTDNIIDSEIVNRRGGASATTQT